MHRQHQSRAPSVYRADRPERLRQNELHGSHSSCFHLCRFGRQREILIAGEGPEDIGFPTGELEYEGDIKLVLIALLKTHGWKENNFGSESIKIRDAPKVHRQTAVRNAEIKKIIGLIADAHWNHHQMSVVVIDVRKEKFKEIRFSFRSLQRALPLDNEIPLKYQAVTNNNIEKNKKKY